MLPMSNNLHKNDFLSAEIKRLRAYIGFRLFYSVVFQSIVVFFIPYDFSSNFFRCTHAGGRTLVIEHLVLKFQHNMLEVDLSLTKPITIEKSSLLIFSMLTLFCILFV